MKIRVFLLVVMICSSSLTLAGSPMYQITKSNLLSQFCLSAYLSVLEKPYLSSKILFSSYSNYVGSNGDGACQLYILDVDSTGIIQLTNHVTQGIVDLSLAVPYGASISSDGSTILYERIAFPGLHVMDSDGENLVRLFDDYEGKYSSKAISPDGNRIYFSPDEDMYFEGTSVSSVNRHLYSVGSDGSGLTKILTISEDDFVSIKVSPSGEYLGFITSANLFGSSSGKNKMFIINSDGSELRQISQEIHGEVSAFSFSRIDTLAYWSEAGIYAGNIDGTNIDLIYSGSFVRGSLSMSGNGKLLAASLSIFDTSISKIMSGMYIIDVESRSILQEIGFQEAFGVNQLLSPTQLSDDGNDFYFLSNIDLTGNNPENHWELFVSALNGVAPITPSQLPISDVEASDVSPESENSDSPAVENTEAPADSTGSSPKASSGGGAFGPYVALGVFSLCLFRLYSFCSIKMTNRIDSA